MCLLALGTYQRKSCSALCAVTDGGNEKEMVEVEDGIRLTLH